MRTHTEKNKTFIGSLESERHEERERERQRETARERVSQDTVWLSLRSPDDVRRRARSCRALRTTENRAGVQSVEKLPDLRMTGDRESRVVGAHGRPEIDNIPAKRNMNFDECNLFQ